jgi:hypothetical protein
MSHTCYRHCSVCCRVGSLKNNTTTPTPKYHPLPAEDRLILFDNIMSGRLKRTKFSNDDDNNRRPDDDDARGASSAWSLTTNSFSTSSAATTMTTTPGRFSFGPAAPATLTPNALATTALQQVPDHDPHKDTQLKLGYIQIANQCQNDIAKLARHYASNSWKDQVTQFSSYLDRLGNEFQKNQPRPSTTTTAPTSAPPVDESNALSLSISQQPSSMSSNLTSTTTTSSLFPSYSTASTNTTTSTNNNSGTSLFGNLVPASHPIPSFSFATAATTTNPLSVTPVPTPHDNSQVGGHHHDGDDAADDDDHHVLDVENDPNDRIQRVMDPDWEDVGEYAKVRMYHLADPKVAHSGLVTFRTGCVLRLQRHTHPTNHHAAARMVLRDGAGMKVHACIGIPSQMKFTLSSPTTPTTTNPSSSGTKKPLGQIFFYGCHASERGIETLAIKAELQTAQHIHAKLVQLAG